nr:uncharacterized protein LOC110075192 [Pogona vitticeps]
MGKVLVICSIVVLLILLQTDINVSSSRSGSSRPSGGSNRGSHHKPSRPSNRPSKPVHQPSRPVHQPSRPVHQPSKPVHQPSRPVNQPSKPVHQPSRPVHQPAKPVETPVKPANNPVKPVQNEPVQSPHQPIKPVQNPAPPQHNPANPPPHNPAHPPQYNPAYPPHNPANPPLQNPAYPPHNPANAPQNPAYPPQPNPAYPGQNPGYPPRNPGYPQNPIYPQNPGFQPHNPAYPHNPNGGQYKVKPWQPKPPKTKMKHIVGAAVGGAAVGALGGFLLGRTMSNMNFHFNNRDEERWWYENRDRYSNRVYYPKYEQPVPEDVFVKDCWNITVREFITPTGNETADEMETRVVTRVVQEMCIEQYRSFSRQADGGTVGHGDHRPQERDPSKPLMKFVEGEAITDIAVEEARGYLFGSAMSTVHFHFNDSGEQQWWEENRGRFASHIFHPNYSQPVPKDVFVSDCVNDTTGAYVKSSGNQTANETEVETRVVTRVVPEICRELYCGYLRNEGGGSFADSCESRPPEPTVPVKLAIKYMEGVGAAFEGMVTKASGDGVHNSAVSNTYIHLNEVFLLGKSSTLLIVLLSTFLLLP